MNHMNRTNKMLFIAAGVLLILVTLMIGLGNLALFWVYSSILSKISMVFELVSLLVFTVFCWTASVGRLEVKWFVLPVCLYFLSLSVESIFSMVQYDDVIYSQALYFLWDIVLFVLLILTFLGVLSNRIPAVIALSIQLLSSLIGVMREIRYIFWRLSFQLFYFLYHLGGLLLWVAILLTVLSMVCFTENVQPVLSSTLQHPPRLEKQENLALCIVLSIVTCGIYSLFWEYRLCRSIRRLNGEDDDCIGEYLCLLFVPFYKFYWYCTRSKKVYAGMMRIGCPASDNSAVNLLLSLLELSIVADALLQNDLNKAANALAVWKHSGSAPKEVFAGGSGDSDGSFDIDGDESQWLP